MVVTRAAEQADGLARALESLGAEVLRMPAVGFSKAADMGPLDAAIENFGEFDWVLLTSQNAVRFFVERADDLGRGSEWLSQARARVAVIGPVTAEAAEHKGVTVNYVAKEQTGERLAQELAQQLRGKNVLLPRSDKADDRLPEALRALGAHVTEVVVYRTRRPGISTR